MPGGSDNGEQAVVTKQPLLVVTNAANKGAGGRPKAISIVESVHIQ